MDVSPLIDVTTLVVEKAALVLDFVFGGSVELVAVVRDAVDGKVLVSYSTLIPSVLLLCEVIGVSGVPETVVVGDAINLFVVLLDVTTELVEASVLETVGLVDAVDITAFVAVFTVLTAVVLLVLEVVLASVDLERVVVGNSVEILLIVEFVFGEPIVTVDVILSTLLDVLKLCDIATMVA